MTGSLASIGVRFLALPLCVLLSIPCGVWADEAEDFELSSLFSRREANGFFDVIAEDYASMVALIHVCEKMSELGLELFPLPAPVRPILVQLRKPADLSISGDYTIRIRREGSVVINIKWSSHTELDTVCQALASGFLNHAAVVYFGINSTANIPDWLELAVSQVLIVALRPAYVDHYRRLAFDAGMLEAAALLSARSPFPIGKEQVLVNAYFFLKNLESELDDETLRLCLYGFLQGVKPLQVMQHVLPAIIHNSRDLELWWGVCFNHYVRSRQSHFFTMQESREMIEQFEALPIELAEGARLVSGEELWEYRENARFQQQIVQRLREIKLYLQKFNPVYTNSLLSLGLSFEALQSGSHEACVENQQQFEKDYSDAVAFENGIVELLDY